MSDSSIIEARLSVLERRLSEIQSRLQKSESTQTFKIEAGIVSIEEAPIKNATISAASDECITANREAIVDNATRSKHGGFLSPGMNTDAYKAKDDDAVSHSERYDELHSWKVKADAYIAANRDAAFESAMRSVGKYDEMQLRRMGRRRNEMLDNIADLLTPREGYRGRDFDMRKLGRALGQMQALAELQALIEVNERGLEAKEKILEELNHPPFKKFPIPEGWGAPCVDYVRQCLYRTAGYPSLNWPLNGGSIAGV